MKQISYEMQKERISTFTHDNTKAEQRKDSEIIMLPISHYPKSD